MKKEWLVIAEKKAAVNLTKTMHALPATPRELYWLKDGLKDDIPFRVKSF
jgi:hypothetical protein